MTLIKFLTMTVSNGGRDIGDSKVAKTCVGFNSPNHRDGSHYTDLHPENLANYRENVTGRSCCLPEHSH